MQTIEFLTMRDIRIPFDNTEAFQLRKDRPALWLQKACLFVLRKLKAYYRDEKITIERHTIDAPTFMDRLFSQRKDLQRMFNMLPDHILIGAEDYASLMREEATTKAFSFNAEYWNNRTVLGMKVEVIPWMRGILVMPSENDRRLR